MVGGLEFFLLVLEMAASSVVHFHAADMTSFLPTNVQKHVCISTHLQTPPDADLSPEIGLDLHVVMPVCTGACPVT